MSKEEHLSFLSKKLNIDLSKEQIDAFLKYYELLIEWNEKINLTAITEYEEVCLKHFVDSMSIVNAFSSFKEAEKFFSGKTLIDVGTGAGFPGVCLKILFPQIKITLMDSLDKRIRFLGAVTEELGLSGVTLVHGRAEELGRKPGFREQFSVVVSRAVASLPVLLEYALPFTAPGGLFLAYKGADSDEEVRKARRAAVLLGGSAAKSEVFVLPESDYGRSLIAYRKIRSTPPRYPRGGGAIRKKPLGQEES